MGAISVRRKGNKIRRKEAQPLAPVHYDLPVGPIDIRFKNPIRIYQNLRNSLQRLATRVKSWGELHAFFDTVLKSSDAKNTVKSQLEEYRSWVHIATSVIYRRVSEIPYKFYRGDTSKEIKPNTSIYKTINKIFNEPNPFMSFRFLKSFVQLQLDLTGKAFVLRIDDNFGMPYQLWPLMTKDFFELEKGNGYDGWIKSFVFKIDNNYVRYNPDNILYFRYPNPNDPRDGISPIQSQAYAVDVDHYIEVYERDFFKNSARPDFLIKFPEEIQLDGEEEAEKIKAQWQKSFRGEGNFHNIGILDQGGAIEQLTPKNKDLDLMFLAKWSEKKILAAYNVPPGKVGLVEDVNRANAVGIDITFNSEAILPRLLLQDDVYTRGIMKRFDERLLLKHDNPIPRDRELDIEEVKTKVATPTWTINEARELEGKPPVPGGDEVMVPLNHMPLSIAMTMTPPTEEEPKEPEGVNEDNEDTEGEGAKAIEKEFNYSDAWLRRKWYSFKAFTGAWESIWRNRFKDLFQAQQEEVIQNLNKLSKTFRFTWSKAIGKYNGWSAVKIGEDLAKDTKFLKELCELDNTVVGAKIVIDHLVKASKVEKVFGELMQKQPNVGALLFDWNGNIEQFSIVARSLVTEIVKEAGDAELSLLGLDLRFDLENVAARQFIGTKVREFSRNVLSTKYDKLSKTLTEGFAAGETIEQLVSRVQDVYKQVLSNGYDAIRIARTEVLSSSNAGSFLAYEQSGVVEEKGWLAAKDGRTRGAEVDDPADHLHMDGQRVALNESFTDPKTGSKMMYPGDTSLGAGGEDIINCRCAIIPFIVKS